MDTPSKRVRKRGRQRVNRNLRADKDKATEGIEPEPFSLKQALLRHDGLKWLASEQKPTALVVFR